MSAGLWTKGSPVRFPVRAHAWVAGQKGLARNIQSHEKQGPTAKIALPAKIFRIEGQMKIFPDKKKLKEFIITKPLLYEVLLKGII